MSDEQRDPAVATGASPLDPVTTLAPPGGPPPEWRSFDLETLRARLVEIKDLLEQATAVGIAQDADRLEALTRLAQRSREEAHGPPGRRRYR